MGVSGITAPHHLLEHIAWSKPDSKTLEHLVWSVYDGLLSPGPTLKLTGPELYNKVTRHLAAKVFRGLQVCCSARTSAQFDEPPPTRVWSVVFVQPPSEIVRKTETMDTTSQKVENAEEGAVGGKLCIDLDRHPMAWMRNHQRCYDDEMINFWPLFHPLMMGEEPQHGTLCTTCYQHGTGPPSHTPHPALPPQLIWRSGNGCLWIERELGKICG